MKDFTLDIYIEENGKRRPFHLWISAPRESSHAGEYYCRIHAPVLFKRDKDIFGIDQKQAHELSIEFIKRLLADRRLIDKEGEEFTLD